MLLEESPNVAGDVSFEDADCVSFGFASSDCFGDEVLGSLLINHSGDHDPVKGAVGLAISGLVEPMFGVEPTR